MTAENLSVMSEKLDATSTDSSLKLEKLDDRLHRVAQKERMFLKWVVVGRVKVGDLPNPPENNAEGSVQ